MQNVPSASTVVYYVCCEMYSRPDVLFAVRNNNRFQQIQLRVSYYIDVGYLTDADDLKSQTGYVLVFELKCYVDLEEVPSKHFCYSSAEASV
ncbi:hypothetical protein Tco_0093797 [Tanacetum coccineum]